MMREELRRQVVYLFQRKGPASLPEAFECLKRSLQSEDIGQHAPEIIQIWEEQSQWTRHTQGGQRDHSMPPTPSASSATNSNHWASLEERRPLKIPPQCTDDGDAISSAFFDRADSFWPTGSKHHNGLGSYITSAVLSEADVNFEKGGMIKLPWKFLQHSPHTPHLPLGQVHTTLFNIVSREEAAHIGMTGMAGGTGRTDCNILLGEDFRHPVDQQYKAVRELVVPTPPRAPSPPCRADSPAPSTVSVTRSNPPGVQPGVQNLSPPQFSVSFKGGPCPEFSATASAPDPQFFTFAQTFAQTAFQSGVSQSAARLPTLDTNNPHLSITGAVDNRSTVHMADRSTDNINPMVRTGSQTGHVEQAGIEHRNKRKAAEEVAPAGHRRRIDINSLIHQHRDTWAERQNVDQSPASLSRMR